jgi:hypothetical protein
MRARKRTYLARFEGRKKRERRTEILRRSLSMSVYVFRRNKSGPHGGVLQRRLRRQRFTQLSRLRMYRRERRRYRNTQPRPTSVSLYKCVAWNATLYPSQHIFWLLLFLFVLIFGFLFFLICRVNLQGNPVRGPPRSLKLLFNSFFVLKEFREKKIDFLFSFQKGEKGTI